ncbi:aminotransferase class I/II-fold pyridoxal phosphate-dependent enzyme [Dokdonia sinensis]|uniref:Aminotransferase class I/II-fold pyridoxal phosphate-dependent enzyme n=1 Tax=Dokdonia sinensis TaxID=2479847 RepID=A0A3M0FXK7_9FLAO|nr:aminotransferase class I/II-fold pyridoxal phosphate-dependent enzyme [Dokdonia sinensis]RMB56667.1 aminotransferase class I/II-fold pyridoxal phosphate-dependent enzyme [Dokdonia sinensis]
MNHPETQAIRTQTQRSAHQEHSAPVYLTSSFVFDDAEEMRASFAEEKQRNIYSRYTNPNCAELVEKMCLLEGAQAGTTFATGMSAIFSTFASLLDNGDHVLSARAIFGNTHTLFTNFFPKWNISHSYFDVTKPEEIEDFITPKTKILYVESPTNPATDIADLELLGALSRKHNLIFIVDNCFATPYLQQPIKFGADLVIHSATKLLDGQGRVMGGITVGNEELIDQIYRFARVTGPALSPYNAWTISKSLETLAVRVDRHCENAKNLALVLEYHPKILKVRYPFLSSHPQYELARKQMSQGGNIVTIEIKGGLESGRNFLNAIQMCSLTANLGDTRTIVSHPASTTHGKLTAQERAEVGISDGLIRISIGLEHIEDIKNDIIQALNKT